MSLRVDYELSAVRYEATLGYGLPVHTHASYEETHDTLCVEGPIVIFGYDWFEVLNSGDQFREFDVAEPHGIVPLLDSAVWVNTWLKGVPQAVAAMREDEKHTSLDSKADVPRWAKTQIHMGHLKGTK